MPTAKDIMTTNPLTLSPETDIVSAARLLLENKINGAPVLDASGRLVGVICQSDLVAQQKTLAVPSFLTVLDAFIPLTSQKELEAEVRKVTASTVAQAMTRDPKTVAPDTDISVIANLMVEKKLYTLPVLDGGRLVGVVGKEDVLRMVIGAR